MASVKGGRVRSVRKTVPPRCDALCFNALIQAPWIESDAPGQARGRRQGVGPVAVSLNFGGVAGGFPRAGIHACQFEAKARSFQRQAGMAGQFHGPRVDRLFSRW